MAIKIENITSTSTTSQTKDSSGSKIVELLNKDIALFGGKTFNDKKKERFYAELSVLFSAGVDIGGALLLIADETTKAKDKQLLSEIKNKVVAGDSLSDALELSGQFSPYEYYSIKIGEETGRLPEVLLELNRYFSQKIAQRRKVVGALSYPLIVLLTALGAVYFMLRFVVPMFKDMFSRFGGELPMATQIVLDASKWMEQNGGLIFLFLLAAGILIYLQKNKLWFRATMSKLVLSTPFLKDMVVKVYLARFCQAMRLLISSSTPLINAMSLVEKMIGFYPIEQSVVPINEGLMKGESLHQCLAKHKVYPKKFVALIKVAEEVNQLDLIFEKLENQYNDEVEYQSGLISSVLEPLLIVIIGVFVAVILLSMYLPLFSINTSVG